MRVCLCVNAFVFVCLNVSVCVCVNVWIHQYVNIQICLCANVLMCSTKLFSALSSSKFYRFLGQKCSGKQPLFETSKQTFQQRFHLSVSPDCKMCVRVTNTGKVNRYVLCFGTICHYLCPIYKTFQYLIKFVYLQVGNP